MSSEATVIFGASCHACGLALPKGSTTTFCPACAMAAFDAATEEDGFQIPGYTDIEPLSRGGMGVVYRARQVRPERDVALKVLLTHLVDDPEMLARFQVEARAMAALNHPAVLPIYEVGEIDGMPFFSMKLAAGGTLAQRLEQGPLPPREAAKLMAGLCRALHYAHQQGVLHRDLKPENFLFDEEGRAYITDFGLAKLTVTAPADALTKTDSFFGSPHYMPPEIASGSVMNTGTPADIYSMGAVLYQCLCGRRPFAANENLAALLRAIAEESAPSLRTIVPGLPRDLEVICARAMERAPAARYASAADLAEDLERWLEGRPIAARPVGAIEGLWRWARRHPLPATLAAALMITALTGGILLALSYQQRGRLLSRSLIDQARTERLLGAPGYRDHALSLLRQAAGITPSLEIRAEAAALLVRPDLRAVSMWEAGEQEIDAVSEPWPKFLENDDPVTTSLPAPGGAWSITLHEQSGRAAFWKKGNPHPVTVWNPPPGRAISAALMPDGRQVILADTESSLLKWNAATQDTQILLPTGSAAVTAMSLDPSGEKIALGLADGLSVIASQDGRQLWKFSGTPVRCAPAWTPDGKMLVAATGSQRGVIQFDATSGSQLRAIFTSGWPERLVMHPQGRLLAIAQDDLTLTLADLSTGRIWTTLPHAATRVHFNAAGTHLLTENRAWLLQHPAALREWESTTSNESAETVFDLALSPDGQWLLTTATIGVRIWSVPTGRQTGFHPAENQRTDAPTAAWWLDARTLLVQVPGGLERVTVNENGEPEAPQRIVRPPGSSVSSLLPDGSWLVRILDDEGLQTMERWPNGDSAKAVPVSDSPAFPTADSKNKIYPDGSIGVVGDAIPFRLIPPQSATPLSLALSKDGHLLIALCADHRVLAWNLPALQSTLVNEGFQ